MLSLYLRAFVGILPFIIPMVVIMIVMSVVASRYGKKKQAAAMDSMKQEIAAEVVEQLKNSGGPEGSQEELK